MVLLFSQMENQTVLDFDVLLMEVDFECTLNFSKNARIMNYGNIRFSSGTDVLLFLFSWFILVIIRAFNLMV